MTNVFPIVIKISAVHLDELASSEMGSYDDMSQQPADKRERQLDSHCCVIAQRYKTKLVINNLAEAEDVYYAVCSGTFMKRDKRSYTMACKIADILRPIVKEHCPETVRLWDAPYEDCL